MPSSFGGRLQPRSVFFHSIFCRLNCPPKQRVIVLSKRSSAAKSCTKYPSHCWYCFWLVVVLFRLMAAAWTWSWCRIPLSIFLLPYLPLIPCVIDPLGRFGPLLQNFLFGHHPPPQLWFPPSRPNASQMYYIKLLQYPSPKGILLMANYNWYLHPTRRFYGHSYLAPTPSITTVQSLGVSLTKAFAHHLRYNSRIFITSPLATNILPTLVTR